MMLRASIASFAFSAAIAGCSSSDHETDRGSQDASTINLDAGALNSDGATKKPDGGFGSITVGKDSPACGAGLAFHPPGCPCGDNDDKAGCWSGQPSDRNRGSCKDGTQQCVSNGEFRVWSACEGEVDDCGEDAGVPETCECIPGTKVLCSEDCQQLIICSLTGTKTCQPDGTWGPCKEEFLAGLAGVIACKNLYWQCLGKSSEGLYVGDCDQAFTCGHPPGIIPGLPPTGGTTPADAGTGDGGKGGPAIQ